MTSSILPPRSALAPCSPNTQAIASTTLDLPEPLGPTTQVMPGSNFSVVAAAKDLKPFTVRLLRCTDLRGVQAAAAAWRGDNPEATPATGPLPATNAGAAQRKAGTRKRADLVGARCSACRRSVVPPERLRRGQARPAPAPRCGAGRPPRPQPLSDHSPLAA